MKESGNRVGISVHMISRNGGFGFQVIGGADANYHPEVELILPGKTKAPITVMSTDYSCFICRKCSRRCWHKSWGQNCQCKQRRHDSPNSL